MAATSLAGLSSVLRTSLPSSVEAEDLNDLGRCSEWVWLDGTLEASLRTFLCLPAALASPASNGRGADDLHLLNRDQARWCDGGDRGIAKDFRGDVYETADY